MSYLRFFLALIFSFQCFFTAGNVYANPTGENVTFGDVDFARDDQGLFIDQHSDKAIIEWDDFSIANGELTHFNQISSSAAVLNRVTGSDVSSLFGTLSSNGKVFLINPNGMLVGSTGVINCGEFIASTLDISDESFLNDADLVFTGDSDASLVNYGKIETADGDVVLVGKDIQNYGSVDSSSGDVGFYAADEFVLVPASGEAVVVLNGEGRIFNGGDINAVNAELHAAGGNIYALAINNEGVVRATGAVNQNGRVILSAESGEVAVNGVVDASNAGIGSTGGEIHLLGERVGVFQEGIVDASGDNGGGEILIGGDYRGENPEIKNAANAFIHEDAVVSADALVTGNGGKVIAYADETLRVYGQISARGVGEDGNGGFIETSSGWLDVGSAPDVSSENGISGEWLIDPYDIEIIAGAGSSNMTGATPYESTGNSAQIGVDVITTALGTGSVTVQTGAGGTQAGDITLSTALDYDGIGTGNTLSLIAERVIALNGQIYDSNTGSADNLSLIFQSSMTNSLGAVSVTEDIDTNGGSIDFDGSTIFGGSAALSVDSGGGQIDVGGSGYQIFFANSNGVTINSGGGNMVFTGTIDSANKIEHVSSASTFSEARTAATSGTGANTGDTYLATVTSALENTQLAVAGAGLGWLGGTDETVDGVWRWTEGPEGLEDSGQGRIFWNGDENGSAPDGVYTNWNAGEPNGLTTENYVTVTNGSSLIWNDLNSVTTDNYYKETNLAPTAVTIAAGAGSVSFTGGDIGAERALGNLDITSTSTVDFDGALNVTGDFTIQSATQTDFGGNVDVSGTTDITGTAQITTDALQFESNSLVFQGAIGKDGGVSSVTLSADDIDLQDNVNFAGGTVNIRQETNGNDIELGSADDAAAGTLELSAAELDRINATTLNIGDANTDEVKLITAQFDPANVTDVNITSTTTDIGVGTDVVGTLDVNGTTTVSANGLTLQAGGLTFQSAVSAGGGVTSVTLSADDIDLQDNLNFAGGTVNIKQETNGNDIELGSADDAAAGTLELSAAELDRINATTLNIGDVNTDEVELITAQFDPENVTDVNITSTTTDIGVGTDVVGTLDVNGTTTVSANGLTLQASTLRFQSAVSAGGGVSSATLSADDIDLQDNLNFAGGTVNVKQETNGNDIELGSADDAAAGTLELSAAELDRINATTLNIGDANTDEVELITAQFDPANVTDVNITSTTTDIGVGTDVVGTLDVNGTTTVSANSLTLQASTLRFQDAVSAGGGVTAVALAADDLDLQDNLNFAGGTVTVKQETNGVAIDLGSAVDSTASTLEISSTETSRITASNLNIGDSNTGNIVVSQTFNPSNVSGIVHMTSGAAVSGVAVTHSDLVINSVGDITLTNTSNDVDDFAAASSGGAVAFTDADDLTVTTVDGVVGVSAATTVDLRTEASTADITLDQAVSAGGAGNSVVLACGRNFVNNVGAGAISTGTGRFLIYSTDPADNTLNSLAYDTKQYNKSIAADPPASISVAGNVLLYTLAPTLTLTADDKTRFFANNNPAFTYSVSGLVDGDSFADSFTGEPLLTTPASKATPEGVYTINISVGSLAATTLGYQIAGFIPGSLTIEQLLQEDSLNDLGNEISGNFDTVTIPLPGDYLNVLFTEAITPRDQISISYDFSIEYAKVAPKGLLVISSFDESVHGVNMRRRLYL